MKNNRTSKLSSSQLIHAAKCHRYIQQINAFIKFTKVQFATIKYYYLFIWVNPSIWYIIE